ncbi:MAG: hypothetical protein JO144_11105 [Actinobacteria bacterium]|nr:hypothetical protein [Actinomycetota bacterium]
MKRSGILVALVAVILLGGTSIPALATTTTNTGNVVQGQWYWGTNNWTTTTYASNIYFTKTDGPEIDLEWYKCSDRTKHGSPVHFENADPTAQKKLNLSGTMAQGTTFCLAVYSYGNNATDTYTGQLVYDVF